MGQHLVHRAIEPLLREAEDSEHDETQVAHRGICHQLLHVGLHHRNQRAVEDADNGQDHDPSGAVARRVRKHRHAKTQQPVGAHFQHYGRQHYRARGRSFDVRVRQPGVQREYRDFDGECDEEAEEQPQLLAAR